MRDYLVRWHRKYASHGLVIIEINQGQQETLETQKKSVIRQQVPQFVLWDEANRNTQNYGIKAWPIGYLIGPDGKVKWEGNPARTIRRTKPHRQLVELLESNLKQVRRTPVPTSVVLPVQP
ncbi:MAG: hypothetical protein VX346_09685 [Planctomycetota bacterium]|nr:hypothetical protein [Planctomycetota bacterium]